MEQLKKRLFRLAYREGMTARDEGNHKGPVSLLLLS
jgi:hypothetical protein